MEDLSTVLNPVVKDLDVLRSLLIEILESGLILALIVVFVVQIFKSFIRPLYYRHTLMAWLARRDSTDIRQFREKVINEETAPPPFWKELLVDDKLGPRIPPKGQFPLPMDKKLDFMDEVTRACYLPRDLFMKKLENVARAVLENPSQNEAAYSILTHGASKGDLLLVYEMDRLAQMNPNRLQQLKRKDGDIESYPAPLLAAQDRAASAIDRNLDDLQLDLTVRWPATVRRLSVLAGILGATSLGIVTNAQGFWSYVLLLLIGAGAGITATVIYDLVSVLGSYRERQS